MSWAANRVTSRIEDMAYCLMGLFNINMPLLYGEGRKAFERLQLEIIKISDDESIFAWTDSVLQVSGLLARWPSAFANSGAIEKSTTNLWGNSRPPYAMTNKGLAIKVPSKSSKLSMNRGQPVEEIALNCVWRNGGKNMVTIYLIHEQTGLHLRTHYYELAEGSWQPVTDEDPTIYIPNLYIEEPILRDRAIELPSFN